MNLIWLLLKESWISIVATVLMGLVSGICSAKLIILINETINHHSINNLVWYFLSIAILALLTAFISQFWLIYLGQQIVYKLRLHFTKNILSAPLQKLEELGSSRLLAVLIGDIQSISDSVFLIPFICVNTSIIFGCLFYLIILSKSVFGITLVFASLAIGTIYLLLNKALKYFELAREEDDRLYENFRSITEGIKELKLHRLRRQQFVSEELINSAFKSRQFKIQALQIFVIAFQSGQFFFFAILGIVVFALPKLIVIEPSIVSAYVLTITYLILPIQNLMDKLPLVLSTNIALDKVEKMGLKLTEQAEISSVYPEIELQNWHQLELKGITHRYQSEAGDHQFTLGELNLVFYPSQLVFIVGGNGSGKSTLAKLITGLYIPNKGEIRFNNVAIADHNREWYRQHFSVVFANFYLFDKLFGLEHFDLDLQAKKYLEELSLSEKINVKNSRLSTINLSHGQQKRLALLTAYLEDRPIYLFDEWAADQDPLFRALFYEKLLPDLKKRGKTVIVISHDDRYFHVADRVIKLDYGKIEYDQENF